MNILIRSATANDIPVIMRILSQYILETDQVENNIDQFIVAEDNGRAVGCACLDCSAGILELRSIAVLPGWKHRGVGRRLFMTLKARACSMGDKLYVRTTSAGFFGKMGFTALDNSQKQMIWQDCAVCDKFEVCIQVPMVLELR